MIDEEVRNRLREVGPLEGAELARVARAEGYMLPADMHALWDVRGPQSAGSVICSLFTPDVVKLMGGAELSQVLGRGIWTVIDGERVEGFVSIDILTPA